VRRLGEGRPAEAVEVLEKAETAEAYKAVAVACLGNQLTDKDMLEPDVVGHCAHHRPVGGQIDCGQCDAPSRDRVQELEAVDAGGQRWYIGKGAIWDDDNDLVVVNWQAPIAAPFYTATPRDPEGLDARRVYRCQGNQIQAIEEIVFRDLAEAIVEGREPAPGVSDALLDSLGRDRSGELAEIVATIQAAQYDVISRDVDQLLVVQGGPGTGKTVVGLHRVSWLLFNLRDRLDTVLTRRIKKRPPPHVLFRPEEIHLASGTCDILAPAPVRNIRVTYRARRINRE